MFKVRFENYFRTCRKDPSGKNMAASLIRPSHDVRSWIGRGVPMASRYRDSTVIRLYCFVFCTERIWSRDCSAWKMLMDYPGKYFAVRTIIQTHSSQTSVSSQIVNIHHIDLGKSKFQASIKKEYRLERIVKIKTEGKLFDHCNAKLCLRCEQWHHFISVGTVPSKIYHLWNKMQ